MKYLFLFLLLFPALPSEAQIKNIFQKELDSTSFEPALVVDSVYGITMYDKLIPALGGDSVRNCGNYSCQGFKEDFYKGGQLLHRGYYENGQLSFFKNYYPNGILERDYKAIDAFRAKLTTYFPDGKVKSDGLYKNGETQEYTEYFDNGKLFISEKLNKTMEYHLESRTYFENGQPSSLLLIINPKKMEFDKTEFFESGVMKEKGVLFYSKSAMDYVKTGKWVEFDETGKMIREIEFENGVPVRQKSY